MIDKPHFQLMFYATAAEALSTVQGEIEELSVAAEGEYRYAFLNKRPSESLAEPQ